MKSFFKISVTALLSAIFFWIVVFHFNKNEQAAAPKEQVAGVNIMLKYYKDLHSPYGTMLPQDVNDKIIGEVSNFPTEPNSGPNAVNTWVCKGPFGTNQINNPGSYYSGRILDVEVDNGVSNRVAAASGGLWGISFLFPVPMSDQISSLAVSSFDSKPGDASTIFVGTGECTVRTGTGLWKTTNSGSTWDSVSLESRPSLIYKVRYDPVNSNIIHVATNIGYYKSSNGGTNFTRYLIGNTTDIAITPSNNSVLYSAIANQGFYKSTTGGTLWSKISTGGAPVSDLGRVTISVAPTAPNTVYFNAADSVGFHRGIYKTIDAGSTFSIKYISNNFMKNAQGWYNIAIAVCPTNANLVIAGGTNTVRTADGGNTWDEYWLPPLQETVNLHPDVHSIVWKADGQSVYIGHDGGLSYSLNAGLNWSTAGNFYPITQYYHFDIGGNGSHIFGGTQDNGISGTTNGGLSWSYMWGGDGCGMAIDPGNPMISMGTVTAGSGGYSWRRILTINNGVSWNFADNGIPASTESFNNVRNDKVSPTYIYNNSDKYIYVTTNNGTLWTALNATAFPVDIFNISVSRYSSPSAVVYASLRAYNATQKLRVYDAGNWTERSAGLPVGAIIRTVAQHQTNNNLAYAITNGYESPQKVFKTTNRGVSWRNITGNLPNISVTDLVTHPSDTSKLYLGSEFGCFRTTNGGINWIKWNNGMPMANLVSEMNYIDSIATRNKFYIVAATYGRSIWMREITGDDPTGINSDPVAVTGFELKQNYPNPFNPSTEIKFALPSADFITLKVFDITGREVAVLVNRKMEQGNHSVTFDGGKLSSGVYFYRITTSKYTDIKKMVFVK